MMSITEDISITAWLLSSQWWHTRYIWDERLPLVDRRWTILIAPGSWVELLMMSFMSCQMPAAAPGWRWAESFASHLIWVEIPKAFTMRESYLYSSTYSSKRVDYLLFKSMLLFFGHSYRVCLHRSAGLMPQHHYHMVSERVFRLFLKSVIPKWCDIIDIDAKWNGGVMFWLTDDSDGSIKSNNNISIKVKFSKRHVSHAMMRNRLPFITRYLMATISLDSSISDDATTM